MIKKLAILCFMYALFSGNSLFSYTGRLALPQEEKTFFDTVMKSKALRIVCNFIKNAFIATYIAGVCDRILMEYKFFGSLKNLFITSRPSEKCNNIFSYDCNKQITPVDKWIAIIKPDCAIQLFGEKTYMDKVMSGLLKHYDCDSYSPFARHLLVGILSLLLLKDGVVPMPDVIYYTA